MATTPKITGIQRFWLHVPFRARLAESLVGMIWQWQVVEIIRVETDAGIVGYGETLPFYTWGRVTDEAVEWALGRNVAELLGDDRFGAGLQMAVYDAVGKALEVPVHRLLGVPRVRDWVPVAWWSPDLPPDVLAEDAKDAVTAGFAAHKFKPRPWFDVYAQVEAVSAVTPEAFRMGLDWNGMLRDAGTARPVVAQLQQYQQVGLFETPIPHEDIAGYRDLREWVERPLVAHFTAKPSFATLVENHSCHGLVVHDGIVSVTGKGLQAAAFNKPFWLQIVGLGLTTALCAHLGAVLTHARMPHVTCRNIWADDLITEPFEVAEGYLQVPETPGLGVSFDESAVQRYCAEPGSVPSQSRKLYVLSRPDGSQVDHASYMQLHRTFLLGNWPPQDRDVDLTVIPEDGTVEWEERHAQALRQPGPPFLAQW